MQDESLPSWGLQICVLTHLILKDRLRIQQPGRDRRPRDTIQCKSVRVGARSFSYRKILRGVSESGNRAEVTEQDIVNRDGTCFRCPGGASLTTCAKAPLR